MYGFKTFIFVLIGLIAGIAAVVAGNLAFSLIPFVFASYHLGLLLYRRRKHEAKYGKEPEDELLKTHWSKLTRNMTKKRGRYWQ